MSKWSKFSDKQTKEELTLHLTMNLRQVIRKDNSIRIEQMVEYRNQQNMVVQTEWVVIPVIMEN